jgi:hypothetical protein
MRLMEVVENGYLFFLNAEKTRSGMRSSMKRRSLSRTFFSDSERDAETPNSVIVCRLFNMRLLVFSFTAVAVLN